jgi:hypothetical protein
MGDMARVGEKLSQTVSTFHDFAFDLVLPVVSMQHMATDGN